MKKILKKKSKLPIGSFKEVIVFLIIIVSIFVIIWLRNVLKIKKYDSIKLGISYNKLLDRIGDPEYLIKLKTEGKILYYKSPNMFANGEKVEKINNKTVDISEVVDAYAYYEYYFNEKDLLEAYTYNGEALYVKSIYGNMKGSSIKYYLKEKKFKELKLLLNNEEDIKKIYGIPKCVTNIKNLGKIYFYAPYPINIYKKIKSTEENKINELENLSFYYAFFFNSKGELEAKQNKRKGKGYIWDSTIFGQYNLFWFIKLKIKKAKK